MKNYTKILGLVFVLFVNPAISQCLTSINTRFNHNVALSGNGGMTIWGWGNWGQLGNVTENDISMPSDIGAGWQSVQAGSYTTFGIKLNGTLWSCGGNQDGNLGIGSTVDHVSIFTQVGAASNWKQIAPSNFNTLALKNDNTLWGWGLNDFYQVGDGTAISRSTPVQISTDNDWKMIGTSNDRSGFAIKQNGTLWAWGLNIAGLLADNLTTTIPVPTQHNPDTDWATINVGSYHILAIKTNGTLWAWGGGDSGETADGLPLMYNRYLPRQIGTESDWTEIAAGERFSMAIKSDGTLWAWGRNDLGQLGDGTTTNQLFPVQVGTANNWAKVACGYQHAIALKTDGSLWTWGNNDFSQLGNGTTASSGSPSYVAIAGCTLSSEQFSSNNDNFIISPNPAGKELSLAYKGNETVDSVVIYNLSGREVYKTSSVTSSSFNCTFSVAQLQSGTYMVVLKRGDKTVVGKKMVKE